MVLVGDDCSLLNDDSHAGRRGLCGISFVLKIAGNFIIYCVLCSDILNEGALAEAGRPLSEVKEHALRAASQVRTYGVASSPCTVPGTTPAIQLGENEASPYISDRNHVNVNCRSSLAWGFTVSVGFSVVRCSPLTNLSRLC